MSDDLRRAFLERTAAPRPELDEELADTLWRIATGELRGPEAARIVDQVTDDPDTAELWRVTFAMAKESQLAKQTERPEPAANDTRLLWGTIAVVAAAAAVLLLVMPSPSPRPDTAPQIDPVLRANDQAVLQSSLPPAQPLARDAFTLRWSGGPADAHYDVRVEYARTVVASGLDLETASFTVPAKQLERIPSGTTLTWRVTAISDDGMRVDSPTFEARVQ